MPLDERLGFGYGVFWERSDVDLVKLCVCGGILISLRFEDEDLLSLGLGNGLLCDEDDEEVVVLRANSHGGSEPILRSSKGAGGLHKKTDLGLRFLLGLFLGFGLGLGLILGLLLGLEAGLSLGLPLGLGLGLGRCLGLRLEVRMGLYLGLLLELGLGSGSLGLLGLGLGLGLLGIESFLVGLRTGLVIALSFLLIGFKGGDGGGFLWLLLISGVLPSP